LIISLELENINLKKKHNRGMVLYTAFKRKCDRRTVPLSQQEVVKGREQRTVPCSLSPCSISTNHSNGIPQITPVKYHKLLQQNTTNYSNGI